jgi:hypothetical protein
MQMLLKSGLLFALGIVALALCAPSFAGPITCTLLSPCTEYTTPISAGNINFTPTLIVNTATDLYTLDFKGVNTNGTPATLNAFALQLFSDVFDLSGGDSIPTGWVADANSKIDNSGSLVCKNVGGHPGWLCGASQTSPDILTIAASGGSFDMNFAGTFAGSVVGAVDLMANGLKNANGSNTDENKWSISQGFAWTGTPFVGPVPTPAPEPGSLAMLALALVCLGFARKQGQGRHPTWV